MTDSIVMSTNQQLLERFGFSFERGGVHTARTMMLDELRTLLEHVKDPIASKEQYLEAIRTDNCLGKRSGKTRILTARHLVDVYALDPNIALFRILIWLWRRDPASQPVLALICAYARDSLLRSCIPFLLEHREGSRISRERLEEFIDNLEPGRFSPATLKSTAQNINSTWTWSGHLIGKAFKVRSQPILGPGAVVYALAFGYINKLRGQSLFDSEFTQLLDGSPEQYIEQAEIAARRGWLIMNRVSDVIDIQFPDLFTLTEQEWLRE